MCLRVRILCLLPKPQHSSFPTFFHFDEAVFASSNLKCLKYFHASSIPLADAHHPFLLGHCTDVRSPCLRRIAPTKRLWWVGTGLATMSLVPVPPRRTRRAGFPQRAPQVALVGGPSNRGMEGRHCIR